MQVINLNKKRVCDLSNDKKIVQIRRGDWLFKKHNRLIFTVIQVVLWILVGNIPDPIE